MGAIGFKSISSRYLKGEISLKRDLLYFDKVLYDRGEFNISTFSVGPSLRGNQAISEYKARVTDLEYLEDKGLLQSVNFANEEDKILIDYQHPSWVEKSIKNGLKDKVLMDRFCDWMGQVSTEKSRSENIKSFDDLANRLKQVDPENIRINELAKLMLSTEENINNIDNSSEVFGDSAGYTLGKYLLDSIMYFEPFEDEHLGGESTSRTLLLCDYWNQLRGTNIIPIVESTTSLRTQNLIQKEDQKSKILEVVLSKFPVIDERTSWEQIIDFRNDSESRRKFLALRNWMIDISRGDFSAEELNDKIEYLMSEYKAHISRHKIKTGYGTFKSFIITTSEILENLGQLKFSGVAKGVFDLFEKNRQMAEIESTAPGKEIGYLYTVDQKFNSKSP